MSNSSPEGRSRWLQVRIALMSLALLLLPGLTHALPDDRDQPIHITADKAVRDEKQGFTVYSGDVQMNQGSMHIEADKLTIFHITEEADKIVAEGNPAKMRQRPDLEKGPVHARAGIIEYFKSEERVRLKTNARIEQDGATVSGDSIDYFIAKQLVKADSDQAREGNRVQVVIPPTAQQSLGIAPEAEEKATPAPPPDAQADVTPAVNAAVSTEKESAAPTAAVQLQKENASGAVDSE